MSVTSQEQITQQPPTEQIQPEDWIAVAQRLRGYTSENVDSTPNVSDQAPDAQAWLQLLLSTPPVEEPPMQPNRAPDTLPDKPHKLRKLTLRLGAAAIITGTLIHFYHGQSAEGSSATNTKNPTPTATASEASSSATASILPTHTEKTVPKAKTTPVTEPKHTATKASASAEKSQKGNSLYEVTYTDARGRKIPTFIHIPPGAKDLPVVIFVPGMDRTGTDFNNFVDHLADSSTSNPSDGYIAVSATYPDTYQWNSIAKARNMAADTQSIIEGMNADPHLKGEINIGKIALIGNSDGGAAVITAAYDKLGRITGIHGIKAVIALSGAVDNGFIASPIKGPDLINFDGTQDAINPGGAEGGLGLINASLILVRHIVGMGHWYELRNQGFIGKNGVNYGKLINTVVKGTLDQELKNRFGAFDASIKKFGNQIQTIR